jgi:ribosomal protein S18 acetylase RimI-like enzyme
VHFVPDAAQRVKVLPSFFSRFARYGTLSGEVQGTADRRGIAIWLSEEQASSARAKLAGLDQLPVIFGEVGFSRLSTFLAFMEKLHHDLMVTTHWYLAFIGVDPNHQGKGVGSALMKPMLNRAQAEGLPCYLETFLARNLAFYARTDSRCSQKASNHRVNASSGRLRESRSRGFREDAIPLTAARLGELERKDWGGFNNGYYQALGRSMVRGLRQDLVARTGQDSGPRAVAGASRTQSGTWH